MDKRPCPQSGALRRGDEHKHVHHNIDCRKRVETEMGRDDLLSKKLSDIEEKKEGYLARRVEASDKERVDARAVDSGSTAVTGGEPEVSDILSSTSESRL